MLSGFNSSLSKLISIKNYFLRELIENAIAPKANKISGQEYAQLTELLVAKDNELKDTLALAYEQVSFSYYYYYLHHYGTSKITALKIANFIMAIEV